MRWEFDDALWAVDNTFAARPWLEGELVAVARFILQFKPEEVLSDAGEVDRMIRSGEWQVKELYFLDINKLSSLMVDPRGVRPRDCIEVILGGSR